MNIHQKLHETLDAMIAEAILKGLISANEHDVDIQLSVTDVEVKDAVEMVETETIASEVTIDADNIAHLEEMSYRKEVWVDGVSKFDVIEIIE